ncbi:MAG: sigma-70 family RNA polymerase sigma factor [bacterium]|nr:sigma-70 family RNA polymerase sigma factor [bacterium]
MTLSHDTDKLTEHLFRHESGKMVSVLTNIFGVENLETAEDVVQQTFMDAIAVWKLKGIPENPSAWLFRVAKNKAIDVIRRNKHSVRFDFSEGPRALLTSEYTLSITMDELFKDELIKDDQLKMMFACCHPGISSESQITLILKTLCAFSTAEIAKAFLTTEDTVSKRLYRAKEFFRNEKVRLEIPSVEELKNRTNSVLRAIYLLFNEGYNSTHSQEVIREDLMDEAMMLCKLLAENRYTQVPEVFALTALMCFHAARSKSRTTVEGEIILLPEQDRKKWNHPLIAEGNRYLNIAAFGDEISSYHLEAAIAFEHCSAETFDKTNWMRVLQLYEWLCRVAPSPVTELNRIIAFMQVKGPAAALKEVDLLENKKSLKSYYLYHALLGDIHSKLNNRADARSHFESAIQLTKSRAEQKVLYHKILALA